MNNKGFLARDWVVAFTVCVAVIGLCYLGVEGLATEYDNTDIIDEEFDATYNKFPTMSSKIDDMFEESSSEEGISMVGAVTALFSATFTVIQLIFSTLLLPGAMLRNAMIDMGVPTAVGNIMFVLPIAIVTVVIVLVILSSVSRGKV